MGFRIEETFRVEAPLDRVWRYIIDPHRVVRCLPGAELTGEEAERTYLGRVKVKVGPVTASYSGRAQLADVDEASHSVRLTGDGRETGGAGSARLVMTSRVIALPGGATEIRVEADVDIAGKIVQFGRGMIEGVSKQLFRQFADCVRAELETPLPAAASTAPSTTASPALAGSPAAAPPSSPPAVEPVRALPLVLKWLWSALLDLIRRLIPRSPAR
jgi:hypothetical protein